MGYILTGRDDNGNEYLMHYGVKGMKWGKHKVLQLINGAKQGLYNVATPNKLKNRVNDIIKSAKNNNPISKYKANKKAKQDYANLNKEADRTTKYVNHLGKKYKWSGKPMTRQETKVEMSKLYGKDTVKNHKDYRRKMKAGEMMRDKWDRDNAMQERAKYTQTHKTDYEKRQAVKAITDGKLPISKKIKTYNPKYRKK